MTSRWWARGTAIQRSADLQNNTHVACAGRGLVLGSGLLDDYGVGLADVGVVDLAGVELQITFENQIHGGAARQLRLGPAREKHSSQASDSANARANSGTLAAISDCSDPCAGCGGGSDGCRVLTLAARAGDLAF